jgi:hypothetical protein
VRQLRFGVLALFACMLAVAGGVAHAAKPKQAVFRVTLSATLKKTWTFSRVELEADCTQTTRGVGRWEAKLSAKRPGRVRAIAAGGGKVRFSGATLTAIAGTASRSGTMTVSTGGQPPCERRTRSVRCGTQRRTFKGGSSSLRSPRKGVLQLGSLRGAAAARSFPGNCLEEPAEIRAIRTDLPLATGPLAVEDVFGSDVTRFFVSGDTEQVSTLEGVVNGQVTERVRWTLVFTRLAR